MINFHLGPPPQGLRGTSKKWSQKGTSETTFIVAKSCACPKGAKGAGATWPKPGAPQLLLPDLGQVTPPPGQQLQCQYKLLGK